LCHESFHKANVSLTHRYLSKHYINLSLPGSSFRATDLTGTLNIYTFYYHIEPQI